MPLLNDIHSAINETRVSKVELPTDIESLQATLLEAKNLNLPISISGGQHAMGGQQFSKGAIHIDTSKLNKIINFDKEKGLLTVESGVMWPQITDYLQKYNATSSNKWAIHQKQSGGDNFSIGGSLSANIHGRGLTAKPFISDIESFKILLGSGETLTCDRTTNPELFSLAIGGYGLFGIIYEVTLILVPWSLLKRKVEIKNMDTIIESFNQRIEEGYLYGDFQFNNDENSNNFLNQGIFPCYHPVPGNEIPDYDTYPQMSPDQWRDLYIMGHVDKAKVNDLYIKYYLQSDGNIYDTNYHQHNYYPEHYHPTVDKAMNVPVPSSEMISEIYVPRQNLAEYMTQLRSYFKKNNVFFFFGTVRLIQKDTESYLAWAKEDYACIVFNLHFEHSDQGIEKVKTTFQHMIDEAIKFGGNYYLTYHRWARKDQVETCYPQFRQFLKLKLKYDPDEIFQSNWYLHYKDLFQD